MTCSFFTADPNSLLWLSSLFAPHCLWFEIDVAVLVVFVMIATTVSIFNVIVTLILPLFLFGQCMGCLLFVDYLTWIGNQKLMWKILYNTNATKHQSIHNNRRQFVTICLAVVVWLIPSMFLLFFSPPMMCQNLNE